MTSNRFLFLEFGQSVSPASWWLASDAPASGTLASTSMVLDEGASCSPSCTCTVAMVVSLLRLLGSYQGVQLFSLLQLLGHHLHLATKQEGSAGVQLLYLVSGPLLLLDPFKVNRPEGNGMRNKEIQQTLMLRWCCIGRQRA